MESSVRLGRIKGIEIGVNYSWIIIFGLVTWTLGASYYPAAFPGWSPLLYWTVAVISALLLFASVLAHELAHSLAATSRGIPVRSITLFLFGGVSNIAEEAKSPGDELFLSAVGPLTSLGLGAAFGALWYFTKGINEQLTAMFFYLGTINVLLAIFNLIPGFPLDGGRVLRSLIWAVTRSLRRATIIAAAVGQAVAYLFILGGLFLVFGGDFISGIWLIFIGWFLNNAADASRRQVAMRESLRGVRVADLMTLHPITAPPHLTISQLIHDYVLRQNVRALPIVEGDRLLGMVTVADIRHVPLELWDTTTVDSLMVPTEKLARVRPDDSLNQAVTALAEKDYHQLPVVRGDSLVGLLSRSNLVRFLRTRDELGISSSES